MSEIITHNLGSPDILSGGSFSDKLDGNTKNYSGNINEFYSSLYDINGGEHKMELAIKAKQHLENKLNNSLDEIKHKAIKFVAGKLADYNQRLKDTAHVYLTKKIDEGFNKYTYMNGGLALSENNLKTDLFNKLGGSIDITNQNVFNKMSKKVNEKIDLYYDNYKNGNSSKNIFKSNIEKLVDDAKYKLKEKIKGGTKDAIKDISSYLSKKLGGDFRGGNIDSEVSSEFKYGADLDEVDLKNLETDYNNIINEIKKIDTKIHELIESTNLDNKKEIFHDLIIKRRILLESVKSLEMKYNSIKRDIDDRLDNAIDLIREDKLIRSNAEKKGLKFKTSETINEVFELNLKLGSANDTLNDLIKLLDEKLDIHTTETPYLLSGGLPEYNFYIGEQLQSNSLDNLKGGDLNSGDNSNITLKGGDLNSGDNSNITLKGGASKTSVITQLKDIAEKYIELVTKLKEKENFILGLPQLNKMIIEEIKEYVIDLDTIIKKVHVLNTRFTNNNIKDDTVNEISDKLRKIDKEYNKYASRLKVLINLNEKIFDDKLKIKERIIGGLPNEEVSNLKNELTAKIILLRDNLNYKINHNLINQNEVNTFLGGFNNLENIDTTYDLAQLGSYDNQVENLIDQLNNFNGYSQEGGLNDNQYLYARFLLYQVVYNNMPSPPDPKKLESLVNTLKTFAHDNTSIFGSNVNAFIYVPLADACQKTFGTQLTKLNELRTGFHFTSSNDICSRHDVSHDPQYINIYNQIRAKYPKLLLHELAHASPPPSPSRSPSPSPPPPPQVLHGNDGKHGIDGKHGNDGKNGIDGKPGPKGDTGPHGIDGKNGIDGKPGPKGETGPHGLDGKPGPKGDTGLLDLKELEDIKSKLHILKEAITKVDGKVDPKIISGYISKFLSETAPYNHLELTFHQYNTKLAEYDKQIKDYFNQVVDIQVRLNKLEKSHLLQDEINKLKQIIDGLNTRLTQLELLTKRVIILEDNIKILTSIDLLNPKHHDKLLDLFSHIDHNIMRLSQLDNNDTLSLIRKDITKLTGDLHNNNLRFDELHLPKVLEDVRAAIEIAKHAVGPKGDTGPTGPPGNTGPFGPTGPKGDTGEVDPKILNKISETITKLENEIKSNENPEHIKSILITFLKSQNEDDPIIANIKKIINKYLKDPNMNLGRIQELIKAEHDELIKIMNIGLNQVKVDLSKLDTQLKELSNKPIDQKNIESILSTFLLTTKDTKLITHLKELLQTTIDHGEINNNTLNIVKTEIADVLTTVSKLEKRLESKIDSNQKITETHLLKLDTELKQLYEALKDGANPQKIKQMILKFLESNDQNDPIIGKFYSLIDKYLIDKSIPTSDVLNAIKTEISNINSRLLAVEKLESKINTNQKVTETHLLKLDTELKQLYETLKDGANPQKIKQMILKFLESNDRNDPIIGKFYSLIDKYLIDKSIPTSDVLNAIKTEISNINGRLSAVENLNEINSKTIITQGTKLNEIRKELEKLYETIKDGANPQKIKQMIINFLESNDPNDPVIGKFHILIDKYLHDKSIPTSDVLNAIKTEISNINGRLSTVEDLNDINTTNIASQGTELSKIKTQLENLLSNIITSNNIDSTLFNFLKDTNIRKNHDVIERLRELIKSNIQGPISTLTINDVKEEINRSLISINDRITKLEKDVKENLEKFRTILEELDSRIISSDNVKSIINEFLLNITDNNNVIKHLRTLLKVKLDEPEISITAIDEIRKEISASILGLNSEISNINDRLSAVENLNEINSKTIGDQSVKLNKLRKELEELSQNIVNTTNLEQTLFNFLNKTKDDNRVIVKLREFIKVNVVHGKSIDQDIIKHIHDQITNALETVDAEIKKLESELNKIKKQLEDLSHNIVNTNNLDQVLTDFLKDSNIRKNHNVIERLVEIIKATIDKNPILHTNGNTDNIKEEIKNALMHVNSSIETLTGRVKKLEDKVSGFQKSNDAIDAKFHELNRLQGQIKKLSEDIVTKNNINDLITDFLNDTKQDDSVIEHLRELLKVKVDNNESSITMNQVKDEIATSLKHINSKMKKLDEEMKQIRSNYLHINDSIIRIKEMLPLNYKNIALIHDFLANIYPRINSSIDIKLKEPLEKLHKLISNPQSDTPSTTSSTEILQNIEDLIGQLGEIVLKNIDKLNKQILELSQSSVKAAESAERAAISSEKAAQASEASSNETTQIVTKLSDIADKIFLHLTKNAPNGQSPIIYNNHKFDIPINLPIDKAIHEISKLMNQKHTKNDDKTQEQEEEEDPKTTETKESILDVTKKAQDEEKRMIFLLRNALRKASYDKGRFFVKTITNKKVTHKPQTGGDSNVKELIESMKAGAGKHKSNYLPDIGDLFTKGHKEVTKLYNERNKRVEQHTVDKYINTLNELHTGIYGKLEVLKKLIEKNNYGLNELTNIEIDTRHFDNIQINRNQDGGFSFFTTNPIIISNELGNIISLVDTLHTKKEHIHRQIVENKKFDSLNKINNEIHELLNDKKKVISSLDKIINAIHHVSSKKILEETIHTVNIHDKHINEKIHEIRKYKAKYNFDHNSDEFMFMFKTINRINIAIDLYKIILHAGIHARSKYHNTDNELQEFHKELIHGYQQLLTKSDMVNDFKSYLVVSSMGDLNYNIWHMIININKVINNQIYNFKITLKSVKKEKELLEKKKEIIAKIDENPNIFKKDSQNPIYIEIHDFINKFTDDGLITNNINDEIVIFEKINNAEKSHVTIKNKHISITNEFPSKKIENKIEDNPESTSSLSIENEIVNIDDIYKLANNLHEYVETINHVEKEINHIIKNYSAIKEASKHNIKLFKDIKCKKEKSILSFNHSKMYDAKVLDIFEHNNIPSLKIKVKDHNIIKVIPLKECKNHNILTTELEEKHNLDAAMHAAKLGFKPEIAVTCSPKLTIWQKYWHKLSQKSVAGKITKFTTYKDHLGRNRINIQLDSKELFHIENCEPVYNHVLNNLNDTKNAKFIKKQLEKLRYIIHQIDSLNPTKPDYELKLKILNKEYDRIKDETDNLIKPDSKTKSETKSETNNSISFEKQIEYDKNVIQAKEELGKLKLKRAELEEVLKVNSPRLNEKFDPKTTAVPYNLKNPHPVVIGGHKMIQHAGNYLELKQNINNVSLDTILLESNSLLQQLNK
jgi:DNA repair exonuclease SbcCD ATPase subunit